MNHTGTIFFQPNSFSDQSVTSINCDVEILCKCCVYYYLLHCIHLILFPFSATYRVLGPGVNNLSREIQTLLPTDPSTNSPVGTPRHSQANRDIIPPACLGLPQVLLPDRHVQPLSTLSWLRTMASDLEVLIFIPAASQSCNPSQCELEVTIWWSQQDHIICKWQRQNTVATELDSFHYLALTIKFCP